MPEGGTEAEFYTLTTPEIDDATAKEVVTRWGAQGTDVDHFSGGITVCHNVLDLSEWDNGLEEWLVEQADIAHKKRWQWFNDDKGHLYALNEDGNKFTKQQTEDAPVRMLFCVNGETDGMEGHSRTPARFVEVFRDWEDSIYKAVLGYIDKYPYVVNCLWWRTRGHFMSYRPGSYLGLHADCDSNYRTRNGERFRPHSEFPTRQTISLNAYMNTGGGVDYAGGELCYPYFNHVMTTKAGDVGIFPTNYMGVHEVSNGEWGTRHTYLCAMGSGTDPRTKDGMEDVKEPDGVNMWTPPIWNVDIHDDSAKIFEASPTFDEAPFYYHPIGQNRPLEGPDGWDEAGGDRYSDEDVAAAIQHRGGGDRSEYVKQFNPSPPSVAIDLAE